MGVAVVFLVPDTRAAQAVDGTRVVDRRDRSGDVLEPVVGGSLDQARGEVGERADRARLDREPHRTAARRAAVGQRADRGAHTGDVDSPIRTGDGACVVQRPHLAVGDGESLAVAAGDRPGNGVREGPDDALIVGENRRPTTLVDDGAGIGERSNPRAESGDDDGPVPRGDTAGGLIGEGADGPRRVEAGQARHRPGVDDAGHGGRIVEERGVVGQRLPVVHEGRDRLAGSRRDRVATAVGDRSGGRDRERTAVTVLGAGDRRGDRLVGVDDRRRLAEKEGRGREPGGQRRRPAPAGSAGGNDGEGATHEILLLRSFLSFDRATRHAAGAPNASIDGSVARFRGEPPALTYAGRAAGT